MFLLTWLCAHHHLILLKLCGGTSFPYKFGRKDFQMLIFSQINKYSSGHRRHFYWGLKQHELTGVGSRSEAGSLQPRSPLCMDAQLLSSLHLSSGFWGFLHPPPDSLLCGATCSLTVHGVLETASGLCKTFLMSGELCKLQGAVWMLLPYALPFTPSLCSHLGLAVNGGKEWCLEDCAVWVPTLPFSSWAQSMEQAPTWDATTLHLGCEPPRHGHAAHWATWHQRIFGQAVSSLRVSVSYKNRIIISFSNIVVRISNRNLYITQYYYREANTPFYSNKTPSKYHTQDIVVAGICPCTIVIAFKRNPQPQVYNSAVEPKDLISGAQRRTDCFPRAMEAIATLHVAHAWLEHRRLMR